MQRKNIRRLGVRVSLFFIVLLFLIKLATANIMINEVMANPSQDENYNEWIELYNNGSDDVDIMGWTISDSASNDTLIGDNVEGNGTTVIPAGFYAVITDNFTQVYSNFNVSNASIRIYVNSSTIGNGLSNSGETINLFNSSGIVDIMNYSSTTEGQSWQLFNGTWQEGTPTPGSINNISAQNQTNQTNATLDISMSVYLSDMININVLYDDLFQFEILNKDDCSAKDNVTFYFNVTNLSNSLILENITARTDIGCSAYANTGELTINQTGNYTICGRIINSTINDTNSSNDFTCKNFTAIDTSSTPCNISINLTSGNVIYLTNESIKFYNNLNNETFLYTIEYWKEDLFGAQIGSKTNTTNTNQKSWSPGIDELDQVFFIKNRIAYVACNDTNSTDDYSEKMVVVRGTNRSDNSIIYIDEVYLGTDDKAKFGDSLRFKVIIYKGNSTKTSVQAWLEDGSGNKISKTTSTNIYGNYQNHTITMPVQIEANCNGAISDGNYDLVVEGLDISDRETIYVEGTTSSLCQTVTQYRTSSDSSTQTPLNLEQETEMPVTSFVYDKIRFSIASPGIIEVGREAMVNVTATNTAIDEKYFDAWAYVFKGRKSITDPMQNRKRFSLNKNESLQFYLPIIVDDENADPGDYKLMVKLNSSARKTIKSVSKAVELVFNQEYAFKKEAISLKGKSEAKTPDEAESDSENFNNELEFGGISRVTGASVLNYIDVYESTTVKAKKTAKYLIVGAFGLFVIMLIWRKV